MISPSVSAVTMPREWNALIDLRVTRSTNARGTITFTLERLPAANGGAVGAVNIALSVPRPAFALTVTNPEATLEPTQHAAKPSPHSRYPCW